MASEIEQDREGLYGICIFRAEHLTDDEVVKVCDKFGEVVRCNRNKNLVFVRYATREEAVACLKAPADQLPFLVRPATRKKDRKATRPTQRRNNMDNSQDSNRKNNNDEFHKRRSDGDFLHRGGGSNNDEFHKRRSDGDFLNRGGGSNNDEFHKRRSDGSFHPRGGGSGDSYEVRRPMPDLVPVIPSTSSENGNLAPTQQVLIGNLPYSMNQCDVYHFCQKAMVNPIHVEMKTMNCPPNPPIRYAEVYVKMEKDAINIVEALNNLAISDHQLVVWRS